MEVSNTGVTKERSGFVTGLAWFFIVTGGFATFISLMQNIMIYYLFPRDEFKQAIAEQGGAEQMPALMTFMFGHIEWFFMAFLIVAVFTLVSAIGLLKRKNWARLIFITLMSLGIVWNVVGVGVQFVMFDAFPMMPADEQMPEDLEKVMHIMQGFMLAFVITIIGLCAWIIRKLTSDTIKTEFV